MCVCECAYVCKCLCVYVCVSVCVCACVCTTGEDFAHCVWVYGMGRSQGGAHSTQKIECEDSAHCVRVCGMGRSQGGAQSTTTTTITTTTMTTTTTTTTTEVPTRIKWGTVNNALSQRTQDRHNQCKQHFINHTAETRELCTKPQTRHTKARKDAPVQSAEPRVGQTRTYIYIYIYCI